MAWNPTWGTYGPRIDGLADRVGDGDLVGSVERDQVYAKYQHEGMDLKHPNGGQAKYQEAALMEHHRDYCQGLADAVLEGDLPTAMARQMERLDGDSGHLTPKDTTILARSGHPTVFDGETRSYNRAPEVPRLSDAELRAIKGKVAGYSNPRPGLGPG